VSRFRRPLALAALLACGLAENAAGRAATGAVTVVIDHFAFTPAEITIEAGTIVEWVNHDQTIHNIILTTARVSSPGMDTGDHYTFRFDTAGDYPYLCGLHPHMTGMIHVTARD
jgi:plastocyanin